MGTGVLGDNVKTNQDAYLATLMDAQKNAFTDAIRKSMMETMFNAVEDWIVDYRRIAIFSHRTAFNVTGGTATAGAVRVYPIDTTEYNNITGCSRLTTDITLPAGLFIIRAWASFFGTNRGAILLYTTGGVLLGIGTPISVVAGASGYQSISNLETIPFVLAIPTVIQLQYDVQTTQATTGLGLIRSGASTADIIHGQITVEKL